MPDEREMAEVHDAMKPQPVSEVPRSERRRIARDQSYADRFTGIKHCDQCGFDLELEREPVPDRCPGCGLAYLASEPVEAGGFTDNINPNAVSRRHASAIESVAGAIERGVDVFTDFKDLIGEIAEALAQRVGKAGR